jgi:hypothetical protein
LELSVFFSLLFNHEVVEIDLSFCLVQTDKKEKEN